MVNGEQQLQALVDGKKIIITEATVRRDLQLEDADGVDCLPNATIFEQLTLMGTMASVIICLDTNQKFNFSKYIFDSMVKNLDNAGKFLMYPRFIQVFLDNQLEGMSSHKRIYVTPSHTKKIFANMRRQGKDFSGREIPLFPTMMVQDQEEIDKAVHKEPSIQLKELMNFCTKLQQRVLDLENTKTAQAQEITSLKKRVKKLEKKGWQELISSKDYTGLGRYRDEDMFGVNDLDGDEVVVESEVAGKDVNLSVDEVTLAQALAALKSAKVQEKGDVIKELSIPVSAASTKVSTVIPTTAATTITVVSSRPIAKGIVFHEQEQEQEQAPTPIVSSQQPT
ncbi:hypothetical protein Tco_0785759 [Tanacetum coccineum]